MTTLSKIEKGYVDQGYSLPDGWTWARVHEARSLHNVEEYLVPVTRVPHMAAAWAVPHIDGRPLEWRSNA